MNYLYNDPKRACLRKKLRNSLGLPEVILWQQLKESKLGIKFRRQYGVGIYSLDFYCPALRLGIELDGESHNNPRSFDHDKNRENFITGQGVRIIRFRNKDILGNLNGVVEEIKRNLK